MIYLESTDIIVHLSIQIQSSQTIMVNHHHSLLLKFIVKIAKIKSHVLRDARISVLEDCVQRYEAEINLI